MQQMHRPDLLHRSGTVNARAWLAAVVLSMGSVRVVGAQVPTALSDSAFGSLVSALSEAPGYFDTDNLISNEDSYLHAIEPLRRAGASGGAYIGVGPDQNFSYIAIVRPTVAFIVDIRRDNLLEHLLFKAIFSLSRNRLEYLCLLFGRAPPRDTAGWGVRSVEDLLAYIDAAPRDTAAAVRARRQVQDRVARYAVPLSREDRATIGRFHDTFVAAGPGLRFNTLGRAPQPYYPDYRRLLRETDRSGRQASFVATEAAFQFVKSLEDRNMVIPVTGDFGGTHALVAVGAWIRAHRETVSAFYVSNVEQYLFRNGAYARFVVNVSTMPRTERTVMIRSYFQGGHPQQAPGYHATQVVQPMHRFVEARGYATYFELVTHDLISPFPIRQFDPRK
jgi:hypothetical protein